MGIGKCRSTLDNDPITGHLKSYSWSITEGFDGGRGDYKGSDHGRHATNPVVHIDS